MLTEDHLRPSHTDEYKVYRDYPPCMPPFFEILVLTRIVEKYNILLCRFLYYLSDNTIHITPVGRIVGGWLQCNEMCVGMRRVSVAGWLVISAFRGVFKHSYNQNHKCFSRQFRNAKKTTIPHRFRPLIRHSPSETFGCSGPDRRVRSAAAARGNMKRENVLRTHTRTPEKILHHVR